MPGCCPLFMWCALCVCLPHLSSPLLLSMSLTVQISSTPLNDTLTMMTCRLLCALLVLALCCCPSVCVTAVDAEPGGSGEPPSPDAPGPENSALGLATRKVPEPVMTDALNKQVAAIGGEPSENLSTKQGGTSVSGQSGLDGKKTHPTGSTDKSHESLVNNLEQATDESKNNKEAKAQTPPTTTTITTTTTTTTTRAATTTEAPTTTTTRAPSRLREIDGSLSSSAWVCAPLLLAVSALACTAVG
ncbi:hypothetical protein ECC02_013462 [Trypanosoma cruzi]|uniref:Mucin TcMUCII n=1 Tax=Trypanosoma cruzi TaxID=5693 RepID=A0A7J6XJ31_TRYCR|nr:hypothetical protein ECC02_013462 [Trypanosoma cruzi]